MIQRRNAALPAALILLVASPKPEARAEDSLAYKFERYTEAGGRVGVETQGIDLQQNLGTDTQFGLTAITDSIAGATPTGLPAPVGSDQVPLAHLTDHRKSWVTDLSRQFGRFNVSAGYSQSREHDYISKGWSLNTLTDFNEKNTTLLVGVAGHEDSVKVYYDPGFPYVPKHAESAIVGVTQVLDPVTSVTLNVTWAHETGYLADQYKLVHQLVELLPGDFFELVFAENRPHMHNNGILYLAFDHAYPAVHGTLEGDYRFYADTYGIDAHTVELRWLQKVGDRLTITPEVRAYVQNAAKFYYYDLEKTTIIPTVVPDPNGPAYSSDYRLSSLYTTTAGLKVTYKVKDWLQLDASFDRYSMYGRDGVTPKSAYPTANVVMFGAKVSW